MAKVMLPGPLERRHLLERELEVGHARKLGEAYLAEGRCLEAVPFLLKGEASESLDKLREAAIKNGDAFLLRAVGAAGDEESEREDWKRLAEVAEASGMLRYAALARRLAEREGE